jgi:8-amino-7-oxononanoate synthase
VAGKYELAHDGQNRGMPNWLSDCAQQIEQKKQAHLWRKRRAIEPRSPVQVTVDDQPFLHFGSNDYLGLAWHPQVIQAAHRRLSDQSEDECRTVWGGGSSPLVLGRSPEQDRLEKILADFEGCDSSLTFSTGYAANTGILPALAHEQDAIFADALNHASLIDGCRLSRAVRHIYRHADVDHLDGLLTEHRGRWRHAWIVTDSVFSMDGDTAPLLELCDLADRHDATVLVDEAHATGVLGSRGTGLAGALNLQDRIPLRVGTLSKALGSLGGFVVGPTAAIDWLVQSARSYVFSTAMPSAMAAAACQAILLVQGMDAQRDALRDGSIRLRQALIERGWKTSQGSTPIIPVYLETPERALALGQALQEGGIWVPVIRPPTVPADRAMLRISLNIYHSQDLIDRLLDQLERSKSRLPKAR